MDINKVVTSVALMSAWTQTSCTRRHVVCALLDSNYDVIAVESNAKLPPYKCEECKQPSQSGTNLHKCIAAHAEQMAIASVLQRGKLPFAAVVSTHPCDSCLKLLHVCGVRELHYMQNYNSAGTFKWPGEIYKHDAI